MIEEFQWTSYNETDGWPVGYFSDVATIANTWRFNSTAVMQKCDQLFAPDITARHCSKIPGNQ